MEGINYLKAVTRGGYCTENGDFFKTSGDYSKKHESEPSRRGIKDVFECDDYYAFTYNNEDLEVFTNKRSQYNPSLIHGIKKACFTETHIVILYQDGHLGYIGKNTKRCCTGLERINDAIDISATEIETTIERMTGDVVIFPKDVKKLK